MHTDSWIGYNDYTNVWYSSKKNRSIQIIKREIQRSKADILFVNGIYSWYFNLVPLLFSKKIRKIVSVRGMLHPGALSQKHFKKKIYLFLWKVLGLHKKCDFHASDEQEKIYIQNIFGKNIKIFIAQNFPRVFNLQLSPEKSPGSLQLVSIALISPMKNHLLVIKALINCRDHICYNIYGPIKDADYWNICLEHINKLPPNIVVKYFGDISPHKVEQTLIKNHVFILPSKSENFGHAIYEAFTTGRPVITSKKTPWNNLELVKAGINVIPESEELYNAINKFAVMDNKEFKHWQLEAYRYSGNSIDINNIKKQYSKIFSLDI